MKKAIASLLVLFVLMIGLPLSTEAHPGCYRHRARRSNVSRSYARNYSSRSYYASPSYRTTSYSYQRPSFYRRHRNVINLGVATGAGALIGGLLRGGRGAGIGALIGAGSGALYTYGLNKKKRRY